MVGICVDALGAIFTVALASYLLIRRSLNAANTGFSLNMASVVNAFIQCHLSMDTNTVTLFLWFLMTQRVEWKGWKLDGFFFSSPSTVVEKPSNSCTLINDSSMTKSLIATLACGLCSWSVISMDSQLLRLSIMI
jgi:hypothetical protein